MNCNVYILARSDLATICLSGVVTAVELGSAFKRLERHRHYRDGMPRLWMARKAHFVGLTCSDFRPIAGAAHATGSSRDQTRAAIVMSSNVDFGIGSMFQTSEGDALPASIEIFRDVRAAVDWLRNDTQPM